MLLRFGVANHRSIRDRQELTFLATAYNEGSAIDVPVAAGGTLSVSPVAAVFGANASGKSNVLRALSTFCAIVVRGVAPLPGASPIYEPFALGGGLADAPTTFDLELVLDGVRYAYGLSYDEDGIQQEWLHAYPRGRRQVWFTRDAAADPPLRFPGEYLKGERAMLSSLLTDDASFLSVGASLRHAQLSPLFEVFAGVAVPQPDLERQLLIESLKWEWDDRMVDLLRRADLGIDGADVGQAPVRQAEGAIRRHPDLRLLHHGHPMPLQTESDGTLRWLALLRPVLAAVDSGGLVVVDELDSSLHPALVAELIRMFRDRRLNASGAQLLLSSHDVSMLGTQVGSKVLDRDQIWLTEKNRDGATELYSLTAARPRKSENLQIGYLTGRYGAVPDLSPGELVRVALLATQARAA